MKIPVREAQFEKASPDVPASAADAGATPLVKDGVLTPAPKRQPPATGEVGGPFAESIRSPQPSIQPVESVQSPAPAPGKIEDPVKAPRAPSSALVWVLLGLIVISFSGAAWWGNQNKTPNESGSPADSAARPDSGTEQAGIGGFAPSTDAPRGALGHPNARAGRPDTTPHAVGLDPIDDPNNKYTVVVITYGKSHTDLAAAHQDFLRDSGMPVNRLLRVKNNLVLSVGASPSRESLGELEERIHQLTFNGERGVYSDAYVDAISKYIDR